MNDIAGTLGLLARVKTPENRAILAMGVTDLCVEKPLGDAASPIASDILISLARKVEEKIRLEMASKLADCDWAPHGIIRFLAFDTPNVAEKIIRNSRVIEDIDLIDLAELGSTEHRLIIAKRSHIGVGITDAVSAHKETDVLYNLAENRSATLSDKSLSACLEIAETRPELANVLARRPDLPSNFVYRIASRVSEGLRQELEGRFNLPDGALRDLADEASLSALDTDDDAQANELIARMSATGRLDGTFAVRALMEGRMVLFDHAIAELCGIEVADWRLASGTSGIRATAFAARAARIDKSLFPSIIRGLQKSGRVQIDLPSEAMLGAANIFQTYTPGSAHDALRRLASGG